MSKRNSRKSLLSMSSCLVLLISLVFPGNALAGVSLPDVAPQLSAQVQDDTQVALQWSLPVRVNVGGFEVERSLDPLNGFVVIASTSKATMSAIDQNVESGQSYYYRIRAFKRSTYSAYSNIEFADIPVSAPVDSAPPSVNLSNPADNTVYSNQQTIDLSADASDDTGVARVDFYCNDALVGSDSSAPYAAGWAISEANNGQHSLKAKSYDHAGNEGVSAAKIVTVNIPPVVQDLPPVVSITSPASGTVYNSEQTFPVIVDAQDDVAIDRILIYDGSTLVKADNTVPYSFSWAITEANNGTHTFTAKAYDSAGQITTSSAVNLIVDIQPVVQDLPP
ncbi:MAG: hypothetical protein KAU27_12725, partial [Desulfuromonadales bacterium]|nr:hypothetical protein [Desulfuromonadales bacterium]